MKKTILLALLLLASCAFTACEKEIDLPVMSEDEYPRILGNWPAATEAGEPGTQTAQLGVEMMMEMQYTPQEFCTAVWYLDGVEYCRGPVFRYLSASPVKHYIRFVVSTSKHSTYREAYIQVK